MKTKMRYISSQLHNYCLYSQVSFQTFRTVVILTALKEVTATNQPFHHYLSLRDLFLKSLIN